jgi:hypothetical protein
MCHGRSGHEPRESTRSDRPYTALARRRGSRPRPPSSSQPRRDSAIARSGWKMAFTTKPHSRASVIDGALARRRRRGHVLGCAATTHEKTGDDGTLHHRRERARGLARGSCFSKKSAHATTRLSYYRTRSPFVC